MGGGKVYVAERTPAGLQVSVVDGGERYPLEHHVRHSPTGFECGYGGSGPADLARCILIDYFDVGELVRADREQPLPVNYQDFKFQVVAGLPRDGSWQLPAEKVAEYLRTQDVQLFTDAEGAFLILGVLVADAGDDDNAGADPGIVVGFRDRDEEGWAVEVEWPEGEGEPQLFGCDSPTSERRAPLRCSHVKRAKVAV